MTSYQTDLTGAHSEIDELRKIQRSHEDQLATSTGKCASLDVEVARLSEEVEKEKARALRHKKKATKEAAKVMALEGQVKGINERFSQHVEGTRAKVVRLRKEFADPMCLHHHVCDPNL